MSRGTLRGLFAELADELQSAPYVDIVPGSHERFQAGLVLFSSRPDKNWSLTDCISFALMKAYGIEEALACDHHFEQAGFRVLLTR
jgi:predicted nucleic acid-binding protein